MLKRAGHLKAALMLVLATAFWGVSFPTMKALSQAQQASMPGESTWFISSVCVVWRFGAAALLLLGWCAPTLRGLTRLEVLQGLGLGIFGSAGIILQMDGLAYTSASTSAFLTQSYCLIIPLWVARVEKRWPSLIVLASCLLVVLGAGVLLGVRLDNLHFGRGEWETLMAACVFTGQILWLQRPRFAPNRVTHFSLVMFAVMVLFAIPVVVLTARHLGSALTAYSSVPCLTMLAILVGFSTLGAYLLMNAWQPLVSATEAGLIYCAEPLFASLVALVMPAWLSTLASIDYPNETLTSHLFLGGGLITLANVMVQFQAPDGPVQSAQDA